MLARFLGIFTPFRYPCGARFRLFAQRRFERRPILFLLRRQFEAGFQRSDARICESREVFCRKLWMMRAGILGRFGGAAKTVEDRLGKARSAAVAAITICFFM